MEILRFEDTESPAPKRKHRSTGLVALGLVAALMGIGTAFASSTIQINGDNPVTLGQGVTQVTGCDSAISVTTAAGLSTPEVDLSGASPDPSKLKPTFYLNNLVLSAIDNNPFDTKTGIGGCGGKYLAIQIFHSVGVLGAKTEAARTCTELGFTGTEPTSARKDGTSGPTASATETCSNSIIYVGIPVGSLDDYSTTLSFPTSVSSDLDYVTVVSTDSVV
jgi:hypothetical protein